MVDYNTRLVTALKKVLPTHYELSLTGKEKTPCITYIERNNYDYMSGDTVGYSKISYTVKVWGTDIAELNKYMLMIDVVLRPIGFARTSAQPLGDRNSTMIQQIMTYEALAYEEF